MKLTVNCSSSTVR